MSTLLVAAIQDVAGAGSKATLPITGSNFTLGPGWGALEFVSATSISAVTNIDITGFATGYDYIVCVRGGLPGTDNTVVEGQFSQSTTFNTGSSYSDGTASQSSISLSTPSAQVGNASDEGVSMDITIPEPNVGSRKKFVWTAGASSYTDTVTYPFNKGGGFDANLNAVDGIRLFWSSGDWTAVGKIYVFRGRLS